MEWDCLNLDFETLTPSKPSWLKSKGLIATSSKAFTPPDTYAHAQVLTPLEWCAYLHEGKPTYYLYLTHEFYSIGLIQSHRILEQHTLSFLPLFKQLQAYFDQQGFQLADIYEEKVMEALSQNKTCPLDLLPKNALRFETHQVHLQDYLPPSPLPALSTQLSNQMIVLGWTDLSDYFTQHFTGQVSIQPHLLEQAYQRYKGELV